MTSDRRSITRRSALAILGAASTTPVVLAFGPEATAGTPRRESIDDSREHGTPVSVTINGGAAGVGTYSFPDQADEITLDNGMIRYVFGRDDAAGGIVTGWADTSITATSVVVNGIELAHNLNGVEPRDPDRQHSFYVDAGGGKSRLVCSQIRVLRATRELVEIAFVDTTSTPLRHEHHLIMRRGRRGLYGYVILEATAATSISEVRMNTRWDRAIFDHAFNWERGAGEQPTYAYLATQEKLQDETWRVDGVNRPDLPSPHNNSGNLAPGSVYSKYEWSLYHYENPMFGHYGNGFGTWITPLGGTTDDTLCAFYGVGPNRHDLAIHQDALILNYFSPNHYGLPGYELPAGYRRLYGPWYSFITVGDATHPRAVIDDAAAVARNEIGENRAGSSWLADPLYPTPPERTTVVGRVRIADGRPAGGLRVLLSTQQVDDVYTIHEPTYFTRTDAEGRFSLPGIPPPWKAGGTARSDYSIYVFADSGAITGQYRRTGIRISSRQRTDLGVINWAPVDHPTLLWQIGQANRKGGEFALAADPVRRTNPRSYEKPSLVPGDLTFIVGTSWEPEDWYYAQTNAGIWTIAFDLDRSYEGTAYLSVASSMKSGVVPTVMVNGTTDGLSGVIDPTMDSLDGQRLTAISRQADRSGHPRLDVIAVPAKRLLLGRNTITFSRGAGIPSGNGFGWDTVVLEVAEPRHRERGALDARLVRVHRQHGVPSLQLRVTNRGPGDAHDVRLSSVTRRHGAKALAAPLVLDRDPARCPVPIAATLRPNHSETFQVRVDPKSVPDYGRGELLVTITADAGRVERVIAIRETNS